MKAIKLALLSAAALSLATGAHAQVSLYLTGAAAFRSQTYSIITNLYGANLWAQNAGSTPLSKASSANLVTFTGQITNLFGSQQVSIYTDYNGAVAAVQNLTQNTPASFLASPTNGVTTTTTAVADLGFSSVYQKSTAYTTPVLTDTIFGVTPVVWVKGTGVPAGITNITAQQVKELASNGALPASYFTGNPGDTQLIYFITRDTSAGQRVIVFKDSGFTGAPLAYTNAGGVWGIDPTGETSTTTIDNQLNLDGPAIGYLTGVDAITVTNGAVLRYNGVLPFNGATAFSSVTNDFTPVINGQYSLWGYEHILSRTTISGNAATFLSSLVSNITTALNTYAYTIPVANVNVGRDTDGGLVYPNQ